MITVYYDGHLQTNIAGFCKFLSYVPDYFLTLLSAEILKTRGRSHGLVGLALTWPWFQGLLGRIACIA